MSQRFNSVAKLYADRSDIVLEIANDTKPMLRPSRSRFSVSPSVIYEEEVRQCIEQEFLEGLEVA